MNAILSEKEMGNVRFEIEQVENLAIDPHTGKFRLVVREPDGGPALPKLSPVPDSSATAPEPLPLESTPGAAVVYY
jgi:hypothetical protein